MSRWTLPPAGVPKGLGATSGGALGAELNDEASEELSPAGPPELDGPLCSELPPLSARRALSAAAFARARLSRGSARPLLSPLGSSFLVCLPNERAEASFSDKARELSDGQLVLSLFEYGHRHAQA